MPNPDPTTKYSGHDAKAELTKFFWDRSVNALEQSIQHLCDRDFYQSVQEKLATGLDLTADLPELDAASVVAPAIISKLHNEAIAAALNCWELKAGPAKVFSTTVKAKETDDSNIPCFDVEYSAMTDSGVAKVHIQTWRRNVTITVSGNKETIDTASQKLLLSGLR